MGEKIIPCILVGGGESGWVGSYFLQGEMECLKMSRAFGGFADRCWQHPERKGARGEQAPSSTAARLSAAEHCQGPAVYDWAFLVSIINENINVITAGVEIKLGLRLQWLKGAQPVSLPTETTGLPRLLRRKQNQRWLVLCCLWRETKCYCFLKKKKP